MISNDRRSAIEQSYQSMRPFIQFLGQNVDVGCTFLDVGSGEGILSLKMAKDLQARRVILIDSVNNPVVDLPSQVEFHIINVTSPEFVHSFQNKANVVICLNAFHEFEDPAAAASNMINIIPIYGILLILDYSQEGWRRQLNIAVDSDAITQSHFQEDMERLQQTGFSTDSGIREFWEKFLFPQVPGECILSFSGDLYSVLYVPRQWGEVKEPPPHIRILLKDRSGGS